MSTKQTSHIRLDTIDHIRSFGHSMYPVLHDRDLIYFKKVPASKLRVDDIVIYRKSNHYVTHRIIHLTPDEIITKGDNNPRIDDPIRADKVLGIVTKVKRGAAVFHPETYYLMQSSYYQKSIATLLREIENAKISYVLLKGLPLHLKYSGAHPRRKYFDFDIMVRYQDRAQLAAILGRQKFKRFRDFLSPMHEKLLNKPIEETYIQKTHGFPVAVDVHYEPVFMMTQIGTLNPLYHQRHIDEFKEALFSHTVRYTGQGFSCQLLREDYLIVYLALHFFHHNLKGMHRLQMIRDVVVKQPPQTRARLWKKVGEIVRRFRLEGYTYGTWLGLNKYYPDNPIANTFLETVKPSSSQSRYLASYIEREPVYEEYGRARSGITLFRNLYRLSKNPWYRKIFVFAQPSVVFMILWLGYFYIMISLFKKKYV